MYAFGLIMAARPDRRNVLNLITISAFLAGALANHGHLEIIAMSVYAVSSVIIGTTARGDLRVYLSANFGWISVGSGLAALIFAYLCLYNEKYLPDKDYFAVTAQILPVLLLVAVVDVRASEFVENEQLIPPVVLVLISEMTCLQADAFSSTIDPAKAAVVFAGIVIACCTLILALGAGFQEGKSDASSSSDA